MMSRVSTPSVVRDQVRFSPILFTSILSHPYLFYFYRVVVFLFFFLLCNCPSLFIFSSVLNTYFHKSTFVLPSLNTKISHPSLYRFLHKPIIPLRIVITIRNISFLYCFCHKQIYLLRIVIHQRFVTSFLFKTKMRFTWSTSIVLLSFSSHCLLE